MDAEVWRRGVTSGLGSARDEEMWQARRMSTLRKFWKQPTTAYRNSQIFFAVFTVGFGIASINYGFMPGLSMEFFTQLDHLLGSTNAGYPEPQNRIWISLAAGNVATLSLMSFLLMRDLRKNIAVLAPLLLMKSVSAALFVYWWFHFPESRSLPLAALGDFATAWGIWYFPRKALAELEARGSDAVTLLAGDA